MHHALCNIIEPLFERRLIHDSYANRVGKGTHRALNRCQAFARRYRYVLQCDMLKRLLARFRLVLHETGCHSRPVTEGIPFLEFIVFPTHRQLKQIHASVGARHSPRRSAFTEAV